jgi:hypothetical protein
VGKTQIPVFLTDEEMREEMEKRPELKRQLREFYISSGMKHIELSLKFCQKTQRYTCHIIGHPFAEVEL